MESETGARNMLRVKDIMTTSVYTVEAQASAQEAAWGLTRRHIGGAPVCDDTGRLVGVLSKGDLVNPEPAQWIHGEATVEDVIYPDVLALRADDPARSAAVGMVQRKIHRVVGARRVPRRGRRRSAGERWPGSASASRAH
jgi:CBS-domain-containing membrane protein